MTSKTTIGLFNKFNVTRTDGSDIEGGKHHGCEYLVLDMTHDPLAFHPVRSYAANAERAGYTKLSEDLYAKAEQMRLNGICPKTVNDAKERFEAMADAQNKLIKDAARYAFLRNEDNWGGEKEEADEWAVLAELSHDEFDEYVDQLIAKNSKNEQAM
jgi:hypothetical protein